MMQNILQKLMKHYPFQVGDLVTDNDSIIAHFKKITHGIILDIKKRKTEILPNAWITEQWYYVWWSGWERPTWYPGERLKLLV